MSMLTGMLTEPRILFASEVQAGDSIFVLEVPHARPTELKPGWHKVREVERPKSPRDVVGFRVLPANMTERNDVLYFNKKHMVRVRR